MKRIAALLLVCCLIISFAPFASAKTSISIHLNPETVVSSKSEQHHFSDVDENAFYAPAIEYIFEKNLVSGYSDGTFGINRPVSRGALTKIAFLLIEGKEYPPADTTFSDVSAKSSVFSGYIARAASQNIINGFSDGTFRPGKSVTCNQALSILLRAWGFRQEAENAGGYPNGYLAIAQSLHLLDGLHIIGGEDLKRYELAVIIYNYYMGKKNTASELSPSVNTGVSSQAAAPSTSAPLSDGEHELRVFPDRISVDQFGNETAYAEALQPVTFRDSYVQALKVGDRISLNVYGLDDVNVREISYEDYGKIWIDSENGICLEQTSENPSTWYLSEYNLPVRYVVETIRIVIPSDAKIIDGCTKTGMLGFYSEQELDSLKELYERGFAYEESVLTATVRGGTVTKMYLPYTPQ